MTCHMMVSCLGRRAEQQGIEGQGGTARVEQHGDTLDWAAADKVGSEVWGRAKWARLGWEVVGAENRTNGKYLLFFSLAHIHRQLSGHSRVGVNSCESAKCHEWVWVEWGDTYLFKWVGR